MFELAVPAANRAIFLISLLRAVASAVPTITFPINSQVPPVARVLIPFTFTFSASTFSSTSSLKYTLLNAPSWLSLDGTTRTLSGVPPVSAANTAPIIQIRASDDAGSVTMNSTLVISDHQAPVVVIPLDEQLNAFGTYSPPSSILEYPSSPFSFSFNPRTFGQTTLNYYAVTSDNTPLPSWITFDGATLSFSGRTPNSSSLIQPPQTWGLQLIASDVIGFAGAAINFNIVVGNHEFEFIDGILSINATIGTPIHFTDLTRSLLLDGKEVNISEIVSVEASVPDWLSFDNITFALSGTPPVGATSYNASITVVDTYQDIATASVAILISDPIFSRSIGPFNANIGDQFTFNLTSSFLNTSDIIVSVQTAPSTTWLSFDSETFILSGMVPSCIQPSTVEISLTASLKSSGVSEVRNFGLNILSASFQTSSHTSMIPSSTETPTPTEICSSIPAEAMQTNGLSGGKIVAIVLTIVLVLIAALLLCFFCYRRRARREQRSASLGKGDISRPIIKPSPRRGEVQIEIEDVTMVDHNTYTDTTAYSRQRPSTLKRQSHSMSSVRDRVSMYLRDSRSSGTRGRLYSENALSDFGSSWRFTQDSAYPRMPVNSVRNSANQTIRSFSRKSNGPLTREMGPPRPTVSSTVAKETTKESRLSIQQTPEAAYDSETIKMERLSPRGTPDYLGFQEIGRKLSGLGHGSHMTTSPSMTGPTWYSGGFTSVLSGQIFDSHIYCLHRDEGSWLTIPGSTEVNEQRRHSALSVLTESTELLDSPSRITIRHVPKSPSQPPSTRLSITSGVPRPGSRRVVGSSPFFAGSSRADSRGVSRKSLKSVRDRYLYACSSPTKIRGSATSTLHNTITHSLRDAERSLSDAGGASLENAPTDPLGITYGGPGESTRQLRDFISRLSNYRGTSFRNSLHFSDTDSRFRSAETSPGSPKHKKSNGQDGDHTFRYSQYGHTPEGEGSPYSFNGDTYGLDGSPQLSEAMGAQALRRLGALLPVLGRSRLREANLSDEVIESKYVPSPGRPASSIERSMVREKSLAASHFEAVSDGEADVSLGSVHGAFL